MDGEPVGYGPRRRQSSRLDPYKEIIEARLPEYPELSAVPFFQLINRRYGNASTVLTSNKGFEQWGRILGDEAMAAALLDRLLHRCHIVNIRRNSYRMRRHAELSKAIHPLANPIAGGSPAATEALS